MKLFRKTWQGLMLAVCLALFAPVAGAEQAREQKENRFLIVVDTASAMRHCSNGVEQAIFELFKSDMKGEFRPGDTIGVWTYNDKLHAELPMQVWSEDRNRRIAESIIRLLREQGYSGRAHLDKVMPTIKSVMGHSRRMTVVLINDGVEPIVGTPFDSDINTLQKQFGPKFHGEHTPFVIVLAGKDGGIFDYTVNTPGSIGVPHTALPLPPPETNAPPPVAEVKPVPPPPPAPPPPHHYTEIVMSGKGTAAAQTNVASPAAVAQTPVVPAATTNEIVASGATNAGSEPTPETNASTAETNVALAPPVANPPPAPPAQPATVAIAAPPSNAVVTQQVVSVAPMAPPVVHTGPTEPAAVPSPALSNAPPVPPAAAAPPATTATSATHDGAEEIALFIIAFSLLAIAISLVCLVVRRNRGHAPSLITQSMDRPR